MKKSIFIALLFLFIVNFSFGQLEKEPLVVGEQFKLYSKFNDTDYKISVRLPDNYQNDTTHYPCLYLFYGRDTKFYVASGIATSMFDATWQIPKMIIVGVTNMNWQRDLTPVPIPGRDGSGGAEPFLDFITTSLFKAIDDNYRTNDHRIFMGHSFGGLFGIYAFIENPAYFDDYILISPSISKRADYISEAFKKKISKSNDLKNTFFCSIGSESSRILRSALWIQEGLESKAHEQVRWKFELSEGHNHHTHAPMALMDGLLFIFEDE